MNSQETWDQLLAAYVAGDWDLIEERATELLQHLEGGGCPPKVLHHGLGPDWDRALARAGCQLALEHVQGEWSIPS